MIEGIEILNKYELTELVTYPIFKDIAIISFAVFTISVVVFLISITRKYESYYKDKFDKALLILTILSLVVCICCGLSSNLKHVVYTGEYAYQVTFDDSVSMNEFNEQYEILDIDGKIYTVKNKNIEEDK